MALTDEQLSRVVTARDAMNQNHCVRGQRRLWNASGALTRGVTYEDFIRHGVTVRWLLETENPYAVNLVESILGVKING